MTIRQAGDALALVVSSSGHLRTVAISDEPALWADERLDIDAGGSSLVVIPQRKRAWGPMPEADLVAWNLTGRRSGAIEEIVSMRAALDDLPVKRRSR